MAGRISYYGGIVKDGLVLDLDAAKRDSYVGVGTAWSDISGNGNNGTLTNGPTFNSNNGGSIVFDGVDDFVNFNATQSPNQPKSIELWVYIPSLFIGQILSRGFTNYEIYTFTDGKLYTYWGGSFNTTINNPTITLNSWTHYVFTLSGTTEINYKNGVSLGERLLNSPPSFSNSGNLNVGRRNNGSQYFTGKISNIKFYNRTISASEVLQNYNATKGRYL